MPRRSRKPVIGHVEDKTNDTSNLLQMTYIVIAAICALLAVCSVMFLETHSTALPQASNENQVSSSHPGHPLQTPNHTEPTDFLKTYQQNMTVRKIFLEGRRIAPIELLPKKGVRQDHSIRIFMFDNFLSDFECDSLRSVHDKHIQQLSVEAPILCFESLKTLQLNLKNVGKRKIRVTSNDFTKGTNCLNETFSAEVAIWLNYNWSYSTAFYPGESTFSNKMASLIQETTGLKKENGGKFQLTSYPLNVGYKKHTDCTEGPVNLRDRYATILVYLDDVPDGGETSFPDLGIWVKPRKGRALVWNNMDSAGNCDLMSIHQANAVIAGHKYILQRWYYYENFMMLGKRMNPPPLPVRTPDQAMVTCDEYQYGSCRWYDEWSYDVMDDYRSQVLHSLAN